MSRFKKATKDSTNYFAEAYNKTGEFIEFRCHHDIESKNSRGYISDEMTAWLEDEIVGYLRVAYITQSSYKESNPTIWNYLVNVEGRLSIFLGDKNEENYVIGHSNNPFEMDDVNYEKFVQSVCDYIGKSYDDSFKLKLMDKAKFQKTISRNHNFKSILEREKKFIRFWMNRPVVDYISVSKNNYDYTGKGIGFLLYLMAAKELNQRGFCLHASDLQSEKPKEIWKSFLDSGYAYLDGCKDNSLCLDGSKLPEIEEIRVMLCGKTEKQYGNRT